VGTDDFGVHLKRLLASRRNECSAQCLSDTLGYSDPATVYRWLRGEKAPALNTEYVDKIIDHLKLTPAEAQDLRNAQIHALTDRRVTAPKPSKLPRASKQPRPPKSQTPAASVAPLIDQLAHPGDDLEYHASSPHARGAPILSQIIELFEQLPDATGRSDAERTIVLTWQSRETSEMSAELEERWLVSLRSILRRGWQMQYLCRLDDNIHRTVRLVEMMRDLIGTGNYFPRYFKPYGVISPPYDLIIIPGVAGVLLFSTKTAHAVDDGIITRDAHTLRILQAHAAQLARQTTRLVTAYFHLENDLAYGERLREAENHSGGRVLIKDGLSVTTQPEWWFDTPPTAQIPGAHTAESWQLVAAHRKARIAAFRRYVRSNENAYYDICTISAIERLVRTGAYPDGDPSNGPHQGKKAVREHLQNTVELLRTYENYHLALIRDYEMKDVDEESFQMSAKWQVSGDNTVFIGTRIADQQGRLVPANLHITEPTVANGFREHFYQMWQRIPPLFRERERVIAWLERQIKELDCD